MSAATIDQIVRLKPKADRRPRAGHPWIYSNEIEMTSEAKTASPGSLVRVAAADGSLIGTGFLNARSLIAVRMLTSDAAAAIDEDFIARRLQAAAAWRDRLWPDPFYRLIHAEGDGLPGLIIDRYGDVFVCQMNAAGADALTSLILDALTRLFSPRAIILKNDSSIRELEGLPLETKLAIGSIDGDIPVKEDGVTFPVNPLEGQKTGWFFDQRGARSEIAALAKGRRIIDFYCHLGGFALRALAAGATYAEAVDRSELALAQAARAAELNGLRDRVTFTRADVFGDLEARGARGEKWDVVVVDPPAFVKSRKDLENGAKGYRKMARLAAPLVAPGGILFAASCSHNMPADRFLEEIARGVQSAGRAGRIIRAGGAGPDHPVHPALPESAYLKSLTLVLD